MRSQLVLGSAGVVEMRECEVALESPRPAVDLLEVGKDPFVDLVLLDERALLVGHERRSAGSDPFLEGRLIRVAQALLHFRRWHGAGNDTFVDRRLTGLAGDDLLARDES